MLVVAMLALSMMPLGAAQQMCPPPSQKVCGRCPNQCLSCISQDHNIKCPGASWGNTNSTFMNVSCGTPRELSPPEQFPQIPILEPVLRAPLDCKGTVQKGLWPFDADNMTFTFETMFRDPDEPDQKVNAIHLHCVTFSLKAESSGASDEAATDEALACPVTKAQRDAHDYSGLELTVCVGVNVRLDPYCTRGRWVPVITGSCIGETVTGSIELTDFGSRLLVRVGGPGDLTGCQPRWSLSVDRFKGSCTAVDRGYGNCCDHECVNGYRDRSKACLCICPPGFVGTLCDRTAPHLLLSLTVFNQSRVDWWVSDSSQIGHGQTQNAHMFTSTLAQALGILPSRVELAYAKTQTQLGTGAQDSPTARRSESAGGVGDRRVVPHCASTADMEVAGTGLTKVDVRLIYTFEHELPMARSMVEVAIRNGTLETALAGQGTYLCVIEWAMLNYNAFGFKMESRDVQQMYESIGLTDVLLLVFIALGVGLMVFYTALQVLVARSLEMDATRHLREYKPVQKIEKQAVGWRLVNP